MHWPVKLAKCWLQFKKNKFIVLFIIIFGTLSIVPYELGHRSVSCRRQWIELNRVLLGESIITNRKHVMWRQLVSAAAAASASSPAVSISRWSGYSHSEWRQITSLRRQWILGRIASTLGSGRCGRSSVVRELVTIVARAKTTELQMIRFGTSTRVELSAMH